MNVALQKINGLEGFKILTPPRSMSFIDHYRFRHGVEPEGVKINNLVENKVFTPPINLGEISRPKKSVNGIPMFGGGNEPPEVRDTNGANKLPYTDLKTLIGFIGAFITSTALAVGSHKTDILDNIGNMLKKPLQSLFDFSSITLGTISAAGLLSYMDKTGKSVSYTDSDDVGWM